MVIQAKEKLCYQNKFWKKERLINIIQKQQDYFRNTMKNAKEEKKMTDELNKMKKTLEIMPEVEKLRHFKD